MCVCVVGCAIAHAVRMRLVLANAGPGVDTKPRPVIYTDIGGGAKNSYTFNKLSTRLLSVSLSLPPVDTFVSLSHTEACARMRVRRCIECAAFATWEEHKLSFFFSDRVK